MSTPTNPRILYIITRTERGGAQIHLLHLLRASRQAYDLALASGEEGFLTEAVRKMGIPVFIMPHLVHSIRLIEDVHGLMEIVETILAFKPELVHLHSSKAGLLGRMACLITSTPCVFTAHGWAFSDGAATSRRILALATEWLAGLIPSHTIAVSDYDAMLARRFGVGTSRQQMTTIHNGIPDQPERANPAYTGVPIISMVARFSPPKDQEALLRALARVVSPFELWFVGDGPGKKAVYETARSLGMLDRTKFLGDCDGVPKILSQTHIFALLTRHEGLPISILEAMRAGLPILASNVGGVPEVITHGENGLLVDRDDESSLIENINLLLRDSSLRARMGAIARKRFECGFLVEDMVQKTFSVYESVIRPRFAETPVNANTDLAMSSRIAR
jgi:glycosyltransferase involved in cell wall biosynthesis